MANVKDVKKEALATINAALTILDRFPKFDEADTSLSANISANPFQFLIDLFKTTAGYDAIIKIISKFIAITLPSLELAIKAELLANIKNLVSCSLNPFISKELLLNGIVFDLRTVDVMNMLSYCPLDSTGKYLYFGCDYFEYLDQLKKAGDFNAFLWFVKNKSVRREVWYGVNALQAFVDTSFIEDEEGKSAVLQKERSEMPLPVKAEAGGGKCVKGHGIITLQYKERPNGLRNCEGNGLSYDHTEGETVTKYSYLSVPHHNCLQVFLGNVQDMNELIPITENKISECDKQIAELNEQMDELQYQYNTTCDEISNNENFFQKQIIDQETYRKNYSRLKEEKDNIHIRMYGDGEENSDNIGIEGEIKQKEIEKLNFRRELQGYLANLDDPQYYRDYFQNYYYNHTLIEFNTDYVMSLKLFDSKTVAVQLIDALTCCFSIDLNLSYEQLLVKYETQRMVKSVLESDDTTISDCFFTFSNEDYDEMLKKAELTREKLYSMDVNNPSGVKIDKDTILNTLNTINDGSSKETVQSVIEGSLREISGIISDTNYEQSDKVNLGIQFNFIENILNNLTYVITMSILSPKLYLLYAINLKILGQESTFSIEELIDKQRQMIVGIIRMIRDRIIQYLVDELMGFLAELSREIAIKLTVEQGEYYVHLIKRLIECFNFGGDGDIDFNVANINYADIYEQEPVNEDEC